MSIWAPKPNSGHVCVKFVAGKREVSLCLDDSCGAMSNLYRGDLRCFNGQADQTMEVFGKKEYETVHASLDNFELAMAWLKKED